MQPLPKTRLEAKPGSRTLVVCSSTTASLCIHLARRLSISHKLTDPPVLICRIGPCAACLGITSKRYLE